MDNILLGGRYEIRDLLGGGGMGKVFLAKDRVLGRDVALKVLKDQYAENEEFVERFEREAKAAASINHPNVVSVYDRGEDDDGSPYIAMEHVPGGTLKERVLANGSLDPSEAARFAAQVADALGAAHKRGVVHRDVKPQNVLLTAAGDAKVADFGIVRAIEAASSTTGSLVLGTAKYMSPEQAMGERVGPPSDLYSLGVVLYEMLTGEVPFDADSSVGVAMKHVMEPPRPPRRANPKVPEALDAMAMKLLEKKPENRYGSAAELAEDLRRVGAGLPPASVSPAGTETTTERLAGPMVPPAPAASPAGSGGARRDFARRRRPRRSLTALAIVIVLLALAGWGLSRGSGGPVIGALEDAGGDAAEGVQRYLGIGRGEIPAVEGLTEAEARKRLTEAGFGAVVERRESAEEDEGKVLEQSVAAGREAERGSRVALAVGEGPRTVEAPDLLGLTLKEAEKKLAEAKLEIDERKEASSEEVPEGEISAQEPSAGEKTEASSGVDLTISTGPPEQRQDAKVGVPVLDAGEAGKGTEPSSEPGGAVMGTDPSVGSAGAQGTPVTSNVSGESKTPTGDSPDASNGVAGPSPSSASQSAASSASASATASPSSPPPASPTEPSSTPASPETEPADPEPRAGSGPETESAPAAETETEPETESAPASTPPSEEPPSEESPSSASPAASAQPGSSESPAEPSERDGGSTEDVTGTIVEDALDEGAD